MKNIIFIPGLGDDSSVELQKKLIKRWNKKGRKLTIFYPRWHTDEPYSDKYKRLLSSIGTDKYTVVAASAGTSLAITLLKDIPEQIEEVKLIAGKFRSAKKIGPNYRKRAVALYDAVSASEQALGLLDASQKAKITSYRSIFDGVIPTSEMKIKGANNKLMPIIGHVPSIAYKLLTLKI